MFNYSVPFFVDSYYGPGKYQWAHWRKLATEGLAIEFLQRLQ
jgi:hypothetical protein